MYEGGASGKLRGRKRWKEEDGAPDGTGRGAADSPERVVVADADAEHAIGARDAAGAGAGGGVERPVEEMARGECGGVYCENERAHLLTQQRATVRRVALGRCLTATWAALRIRTGERG